MRVGQAEQDAFEKLCIKVDEMDNGELDEGEKNRIWNYVLLDSATNREYGNSCYAVKRDYVFKKQEGIKPKIIIEDDGTGKTDSEKETAFVPICTSNVFAKIYTEYPNDLKSWTKNDAEAYKENIDKLLKKYKIKKD